MKYLQFLKKLGHETIKPLYIVSGQESFLKLQAIEAIKNHLGQDRIFFKEYMADKQFEPRRLLDDLYSEALFDDFNLIILRDAQNIIARLHSPLVEYLSNTPAHSVLLIELDKLDQRTKFARLAKEKGVVVECTPLRQDIPSWQKGKRRDSELIEWLYSRVGHYHKNIKETAAYMLAELSGNNLSNLDLQIQKLTLFIKERREIGVADIEAMVQGSKRVNIFELLDAISARQQQTAMRLLYLLFRRGMISQDGQAVYDPTRISLQFLRLIHYRLRQIWKIRVAGDSSDVPPFLRSKLLDHAAKFSPGQLVLIWQRLLQTELAMKSSQTSPELALEQLLLFICSG